MLSDGLAGEIHWKLELLPKNFPPEFLQSLEMLRNTLSRRMEAGCRPIIALFLAYAVHAARQWFHKERLSVHSKVSVPNVKIPNVGLVGGKMDFMTACVKDRAPMSIFLFSDSLGR